MEPEQQQPDAVPQPEPQAVVQPDPQPVAQADAQPEEQPEEPSDAGEDSEDEDEGDRRSSKRARKTVERMTIAAPVALANARAVGAEGGGVQLGEIEATNHHISSLPSKHGLLSALHKLLYLRAGSKTERKKNLRCFSGFTCEADAEKGLASLTTAQMWNTACVKDLCRLLDVDRTGKKEEMAERCIDFLRKPQ